MENHILWIFDRYFFVVVAVGCLLLVIVTTGLYRSLYRSSTPHRYGSCVWWVNFSTWRYILYIAYLDYSDFGSIIMYVVYTILHIMIQKPAWGGVPSAGGYSEVTFSHVPWFESFDILWFCLQVKPIYFKHLEIFVVSAFHGVRSFFLETFWIGMQKASIFNFQTCGNF